MMNYGTSERVKAVGLDLDGTLLSSTNAISPYARRTVEELAAGGMLVFPVTGKTLSLTDRILSPLRERGIELSMVCLDGALLRIDGKECWQEEGCIAGEVGRKILQHAGGLSGFVVNDDQLYTRGSIRKEQYQLWAYQRVGPISACDCTRLTDLLLFSREKQQLEELQSFAASLDDTLSPFLSDRKYTGVYILIISSKLRSKYLGAKKLLAAYGHTLDDLIFFGDWINDISLLKHAGVSVAMRNADPSLFPYADAATYFTNQKNGAARFLRSFFEMGFLAEDD